MDTNTIDAQISYLTNISDNHQDEMSPANLRLFRVLVDVAQKQQSMQLDKAVLMKMLEEAEGKITDQNYRKRISKINEFAKEEINSEFIIENSKSVVNIRINDQALTDFSEQETVSRIIQLNDSEAPDTTRLVESTATNTLVTETQPQVMFSYFWGRRQVILDHKREFADLLADALNKPPAEFKNDPRIHLFVDIRGFEIGEDQQEQQDQACEASDVAVVVYCDGYLHSGPCQCEVDFFLSKEGKNLDGKKAIVVPFVSDIGQADKRYLKNLAAVPSGYDTVLELLESSKERDRKSVV